jgi:hypothetical protein
LFGLSIIIGLGNSGMKRLCQMGSCEW